MPPISRYATNNWRVLRADDQPGDVHLSQLSPKHREAEPVCVLASIDVLACTTGHMHQCDGIRLPEETI